MVDADDALHHWQKVRGSERPPFCEQQIIDVLEANSRDLTEDIQRIEDLLKVYQPYIPGAPFCSDDGLEGHGSIAVSTPGVKVDKIERWFRLQIYSIS